MFPSAGYLGYTSGLSLLCMVFFLIVVSRTRRAPPPPWSLHLNRPFLLCHPGDHQEVPDPVSSASGRSFERHLEGSERHPLPAERHRLQRERLHAKILRLQLPGEALKPATRWRQAGVTLREPLPPLTGASVPQTVYAVPILTFAFVCHPSILPMYEELKE